MSSRSVNAHEKKADTISAWVWFRGATALLEGQGLCYDWDYGTAADSDARRGNRVEVPTILNAPFFAGVAARAYSAKSGGQFIEIYVPGSVCDVLAKVSATIGVGIYTCEAGGTYAGYFRVAGFEGRGSAVPLQTVDRSLTAGLVLCRLQDGGESGLVEVVTPAAGAITCMVGGVTRFAVATCSSDATFTMADGTKADQRKKFVCDATITTSDVVITVNGIQLDGATALTTAKFDAAAEEVTLEWCGDWYCRGVAGAAIA